MEVIANEINVPRYAHPGDAGLDLTAAMGGEIRPHDWYLVDTGILVAIPDGHVGFITPRSGLAAKQGITVLNSPGTIDSGYRGPLKVALINHGEETWAYEPGDRIAQLVIVPFVSVNIELVEEFTSTTSRGEHGFGSTGVA